MKSRTEFTFLERESKFITFLVEAIQSLVLTKNAWLYLSNPWKHSKWDFKSISIKRIISSSR